MKLGVVFRLVTSAVVCAVLASCVVGRARAVDLPEPYQGWADASRVATVAGPLLVVLNGGPNDCPIACSYGPGMGTINPDGSVWIEDASDGPATTFLVPGVADHWALYWELGHQFDWRYLTDGDRARFADLWRSSTPWWDTLAAENAGRENGLEATFAADYAYCALGQTPRGVHYWVPDTTEPRDPERVCHLINQIGAAGGATMPVPRRRKRRREIHHGHG
ncbi:MAG: hypothetical protein JO325_07460 [Solirubrobacterales bacterium]|nr:hypothetical protein [Solirubrobacterales bacterium]